MNLLGTFSPLDPFQLALKGFSEGASEQELLSRIDHLERQLASLQGHFNVELRYLEPSSTLSDTLPVVQSSFHRLAEYFESIKLALGQGDTEAAQALLKGKFRKRMTRLTEAFQSLEASEREREPICSSPVYEPLLRALEGLCEGRLSAPLVLERLAPLLEQEQTLLLSLPQMKAKAGEESYLEEYGEDLIASAEELVETLLDLETLLNEEVDEQGLEEIEECATAIAELVESLQEMGQGLDRARESLQYCHCPRCGQRNAATNRVCQSCAGQIPQFVTTSVPLSGSELDVKTDATQENGSPSGRPELFARLLETLEGYLAGEVEQDMVDRELQTTETRLRAVQGRLPRVRAEKSSEAEEFQAVLESALERYEQTLRDFGLEPSRRALEELTQAGDELAVLMAEMSEAAE